MKKRLQRLVSVLAVSAPAWLGVQAQTDVTDMYLINPSFENGTEGWTLPTAASFTNNGTYTSADAVPSALGTTSNPSDGERFFHTRHGWNGKGGLAWNLVSEPQKALPAGKYYLTCDYKAYDMVDNASYHSQLQLAVTKTDGTGIAETPKKQLFAYFADGTNNNNYIAKADWTKIGLYFELTEETSIQLAVNADFWSNQRSDYLVDNFRLYTCDDEAITPSNPLDVTGMIANSRMEAGNLVWPTLARQSNTNYSNHSGFYMLEQWKGAPTTLGNMNVAQTLTNLPNGKYRLTAAINATMQNKKDEGGQDASNQVTGVSLYAGNASVPVASYSGVPEIFTVDAVVADGTLAIGLKTDACTANWISWDNLTLTYLGFDNSAAIAALEALIEEASAQCMEESENGTSLSSLVEELYAKIEAAQSAVTVATKTALETATQELREAMNAAKAAEAPLAALKAAYALNSNLMDNSTPNNLETMEQYQGAIANAQMAQWTATTVEELEAAIEQLEAARQAYVLTAYPYAEEGQAPAVTFDLTFKMANAAVTSAQGWNGGRTNAGEQYTGAPDNTYLDAWNATFNMSQVVTGLPNGVYELKAATRADASTATANIYALVDGVNYSTDVHRVGNTGNDLGNGWGWTTVGDIIVGSGTVTIGFYSECGGNKWAGADNFQLSLVRALTEEEIFASAQKELAAKLEAAKAINLEANVGDKAFQKSLDNKEYLEQVIAMAEQQSQLGIGETSTELIQQTIAMLANAVEGFEVLNQPAEGDVFNVIIRTGDNYKFKDVPLTFREDGKAGAYFKPGFSSANYAQSVIFTATDETNVYTMSTVFADGVRRYISTGVTSGNGSSNVQIRLTDDAEKALKVKVASTNEEGIYTLYNTEANQLLGCQDGDKNAEGGFYTTPSHSNLALVQVEKPSVKLNITDAGFATLVLPFAAEVPAGVTVYACDAAGEEQNGVQVLTLTQVETIAANTPYIVEGAAGTEATFTGFGAAYQNEYAAGWLTGTFAEKTAAAGTYVLQNQAENGVGFYAVAEGAEPVIGAYRAWLAPTAEETAGVKVFILGNLATGVEGVTTAADAQVNVYTLNGVLVRQNVKMSEALKGLNKGVYIVNGVKQAVK